MGCLEQVFFEGSCTFPWKFTGFTGKNAQLVDHCEAIIQAPRGAVLNLIQYLITIETQISSGDSESALTLIFPRWSGD